MTNPPKVAGTKDLHPICIAPMMVAHNALESIMKIRLRMLSIGLCLGGLIPAPAAFAVPANDDFDSPMVIAGFPLTATGSNVEATVESGEALPAAYDSYAVKSVWFSWTAPTSGIVQIDTYGSHEDSEYWDSDNSLFRPNPSVWLGDTLETLVEVQSGGTRQSCHLNAVSGTTYRIAVYGLGFDTFEEGQIVLNIANGVTAGITGTITDTNGAPLAGIMARALEPDDYSYEHGAAWAYTDAAGNYSIRSLSAGDYRVLFSGTGFATELYDDVPDRYDPYSTDMDATTLLSITNGETIGDIDATLAASASVSGTVTGPGDLPLAGITVWIHFSEDWYNDEAITDENGDYLVENLPPDPYTVRFTDPAGDYLGTSTNIVLGAGAQLADLDVTLEAASKISGTVTGPDGFTPLPDIRADAYVWTGSDWDRVGNDGVTDSAGAYLVSGLPAGTYRLQFYDLVGTYLDEYYNNAYTIDSAADIPVAADTTVTDIDISLALASSISGTVTGPDGSTPLEYVSATASRWDGTNWIEVASANTDANGQYTIGWLQAGTYRVWFETFGDTYLPEAYDNAAGVEAGTDVVVGVATNVPGIDAALALANPPDPPVLIGFRQTDADHLEVQYSGTLGESYVVQQAASLAGEWLDTEDSAMCDSDTNAFLLYMSETQLFWRIRMLP